MAFFQASPPPPADADHESLHGLSHSKDLKLSSQASVDSFLALVVEADDLVRGMCGVKHNLSDSLTGRTVFRGPTILPRRIMPRLRRPMYDSTCCRCSSLLLQVSLPAVT